MSQKNQEPWPDLTAFPAFGGFDATLPFDLATTRATGISIFASRADHVHRFPTSLMEYTFSNKMALSGTDAVTSTLTFDASTLYVTGMNTCYWQPFRDAALSANAVGFDETYSIYTGFVPNAKNVYPFTTQAASSLIGALATKVTEWAQFRSKVNISLPVGSLRWDDAIGIDIPSVTVGLLGDSTNPTRTIGLRIGDELVSTDLNGQNSWAILAHGNIQISKVTSGVESGKLIFGGSKTAPGTESIRQFTADASLGELAFNLAGTDCYTICSGKASGPVDGYLAPFAYSSSNLRKKSLGRVTTQGWSSLFLEDSAMVGGTAATLHTLQIQSTDSHPAGALADSVLTIDMNGVAAATLKFGASGLLTDRLTSVTATPGSTLALTSNGTDETLAWSTAGNLIFNDAAAAPIVTLYPSTAAADRASGTRLHGRLLVEGGGTHTVVPGSSAIVLAVNESYSTRGGFSGLFKLYADLNADLTADVTIADYSSQIQSGFDASAGANITYHRVGSVGSPAVPLVGSITKLALYSGSFQSTLVAASPAWGSIVGLDLSSTMHTGSSVPVTLSYGLLVTPTFTGPAAGRWDAVFGTNGVQLNTTGRLIFGGSSTVKGINSIGRGATTTNVTMTLNSVVEYDIRGASFAPVASATAKSLGLITTQGWASLFLTDTGSKTLKLLAGNSTTAADTTLTIDGFGASRTLKLTGDATLNQDVSTIADASFNTLKLAESLKLLDVGTTKYLILKSNSAADMSADRTLTVDMANQSWTMTFNGSPTLGDWFDQDEKTTASPTHVGMTLTGDLLVQGNTTIGNASTDTIRINAGGGASAPPTNIGVGIVNYYGSSATNFLGDPDRWMLIKSDDGNNYKVPMYALA